MIERNRPKNNRKEDRYDLADKDFALGGVTGPFFFFEVGSIINISLDKRKYLIYNIFEIRENFKEREVL